MKSMKKWKKPIVKVMSVEELNNYIKVAAWSEWCLSADFR